MMGGREAWAKQDLIMYTRSERVKLVIVDVLDEAVPSVCRADAVMWALGYEGYGFRSIFSSNACREFHDGARSCYCGKFDNPNYEQGKSDGVACEGELPF